MAPRSRSATTSTPKGRCVTNGILRAGGDYSVNASSSSCSDQTGPGDCAPLSVSHLFKDGGRVNVTNSPSNYWANYRVDYLDVTGFNHHSALDGDDFPDAYYATRAAARTNPSRPYVDIPVNILELGDVARMIRDRGRGIIFDAYPLTRTHRTSRHVRNVARTNLIYNFGIAPLVGDLVKLANFNDQVQRRIRELDRLGSQNGLRRTIDLGGWSRTSQTSSVMQSNQAFWTDMITKTTSQTIRGHVRWLPERNYGSLTASERQRLAMRSVLGLTIDGSTVWELIPWSWLIDWCSNVGQFFAAHRNIVPAILSGVHIMRETRTEYVGRGVQFAKGSQSPVRVRYITKTRNPSFVAPVAHFPFLNSGQLGILASLAVTRQRR